MKYCPYCGEELLDEEIAFCMECGKKLPSKEQKEPEKQSQSEVRSKKLLREERQSESVKRSKQRDRKKVKKAEKQKGQEETKTSLPEKDYYSYEEDKEPDMESECNIHSHLDEGYDGYYDDVLPVDQGRISEGIDKELIKKIVILIVIVLLIVTLCVTMMYVL